MRSLLLLSTLLAALQPAFSQNEASSNKIDSFLGSWSCVYVSATDPEKFAPRSSVWNVTQNGDVIATGNYPRDHSTGIQGKYRSVSNIQISHKSFTLTLVDYKMINPIRYGNKMTKQSVSDFERQVMSGQPVVSNYEWVTSNSFTALSPYTKTLCERASEAGS